MAKIDDVFGNVPASVLNTWGQTLTFVKTTTPRTYNPTTAVSYTHLTLPTNREV